ncbi:hypothetical protein MXD63_06760 [Frankia sp. Cpl3]|nr:hypothetical protein [Frankia sp. Cpl3]
MPEQPATASPTRTPRPRKKKTRARLPRETNPTTAASDPHDTSTSDGALTRARPARRSVAPRPRPPDSLTTAPPGTSGPPTVPGPRPDDGSGDVDRRTDRAYHLARAIAGFHTTISPENAARLADILTIDMNASPDR